MGRLIAGGPAVLTLMCVQADLDHYPIGKVLWVVECQLLGYKDV
jgi:hypothetical protein